MMENENMIYKRNKGLLVSVLRGKSPMDKIVNTIKTEIKNGELLQNDIDVMLDEIHSDSVKPFSPERDEIFNSLKNKIESLFR